MLELMMIISVPTSGAIGIFAVQGVFRKTKITLIVSITIFYDKSGHSKAKMRGLDLCIACCIL